jgi:flagellar assembly protein FliH
VTALQDIEREVVSVAFELATALVGRELEVARDPGADALTRAMALVPDRGEVVARLHPADAETFQRADRRAPGREPFTIVADPSVERGGCIVDVSTTQVDAQLGPALQRMREALLG